MNKEIKRIELLDIIRGILICSMIIYHFLYDYNIIYGNNYSWISIKIINIWQNLTALLLIMISGFSMSFSRNIIKRGIIINIYGFLITLVTFIFIREEIVIFGILNFIGSAMIIGGVLKKYMNKINYKIGVGVSILLYIIFINISKGYINLYFSKIYLPKILYNIKVLFFLGFPSSNFYSSDYFPIIPNIFMFFLGLFIFKIHSFRKINLNNNFKSLKLLSFIGKNSLYFYLVHQVVCILICEIIYRFFK